jgi:hypothetical protein
MHRSQTLRATSHLISQRLARDGLLGSSLRGYLDSPRRCELQEARILNSVLLQMNSTLRMSGFPKAPRVHMSFPTKTRCQAYNDRAQFTAPEWTFGITLVWGAHV